MQLRRRAANHVDAATARVANGVPFRSATIAGIGRIAGIAPPLTDTGAVVAKVGRTTGLTHGRVTAFELDDVVVAHEIGNLRFDDQIEIEGLESRSFSAEEIVKRYAR